MQAKVIKEGEILVIHLAGYLDYETVVPFQQTCKQHLPSQRVIFNLSQLNFVGSNGITDFVDSLVDLAQKSQLGVRFCRVSSEFRRVLESGGIQQSHFFADEMQARASFFQSTAPRSPVGTFGGSSSLEP